MPMPSQGDRSRARGELGVGRVRLIIFNTRGSSVRRRGKSIASWEGSRQRNRRKEARLPPRLCWASQRRPPHPRLDWSWQIRQPPRRPQGSRPSPATRRSPAAVPPPAPRRPPPRPPRASARAAPPDSRRRRSGNPATRRAAPAGTGTGLRRSGSLPPTCRPTPGEARPRPRPRQPPPTSLSFGPGPRTPPPPFPSQPQPPSPP